MFDWSSAWPSSIFWKTSDLPLNSQPTEKLPHPYGFNSYFYSEMFACLQRIYFLLGLWAAGHWFLTFHLNCVCWKWSTLCYGKLTHIHHGDQIAAVHITDVFIYSRLQQAVVTVESWILFWCQNIFMSLPPRMNLSLTPFLPAPMTYDSLRPTFKLSLFLSDSLTFISIFT